MCGGHCPTSLNQAVTLEWDPEQVSGLRVSQMGLAGGSVHECQCQATWVGRPDGPQLPSLHALLDLT